MGWGLLKFAGNLFTGGAFGAIDDLLGQGIKSITGYFQRKQEIKAADNERRSDMIREKGQWDHEWELASLQNAGWKDDVLFYAIIGMYVYSAIDPEGAAVVFNNWSTVIPEWFQKITFWLVGSVLGVKKIGQYLPGAIAGVKAAIRG